MGKLVSVILPVFNGENYVADAIRSVFAQSHTEWELLIVNDGSTDRTKEIIHSFSDSRIRYFEHTNRGVSASRNVALETMKGDFFCFLDADDEFPANSLRSRVDILAASPQVLFVDGKVELESINDGAPLRTYVPTFKGEPFRGLLRVNDACFCGLTWMIRRMPNKTYHMTEGLTHCEDLLFFLELARDGGFFDFTTECILKYRRRRGSAMSDLKGLDRGYRKVGKIIKAWPQVSMFDRVIYQLKTRKIMFLSFLFDLKSPASAILSVFRF